MQRLGLALVAVALAGCGSQSAYVTVPSNHGHPLDEALQRLHEAGLRATFGAASQPCGDLSLPRVSVQSPRAPARVRRDSVVTVRFEKSTMPTPAFPRYTHAVWSLPKFVGREWSDPSAFDELEGTRIIPCVRVRSATKTTGSQFVVVAQDPTPGKHRHAVTSIHFTAEAR
jgi:hypothetical protein